MIKKVFYIFFLIYTLMVLLFFLDRLTPLEIKNQLIKTTVYYNLLFGNVIISILIFLFIKSKRMKIAYLIFPIAMTIFIYFVIGPADILRYAQCPPNVFVKNEIV
jgi:hypothetical protein